MEMSIAMENVSIKCFSCVYRVLMSKVLKVLVLNALEFL